MCDNATALMSTALLSTKWATRNLKLAIILVADYGTFFTKKQFTMDAQLGPI